MIWLVSKIRKANRELLKGPNHKPKANKNTFALYGSWEAPGGAQYHHEVWEQFSDMFKKSRLFICFRKYTGQSKANMCMHIYV